MADKPKQSGLQKGAEPPLRAQKPPSPPPKQSPAKSTPAPKKSK